MNGKEFTKLKVLRQNLDKMTQDDVLQLLKNENKFQKYLQDRKIVKINFQSEIGCGANVNITTKKIKTMF